MAHDYNALHYFFGCQWQPDWLLPVTPQTINFLVFSRLARFLAYRSWGGLLDVGHTGPHKVVIEGSDHAWSLVNLSYFRLGSGRIPF